MNPSSSPVPPPSSSSTLSNSNTVTSPSQPPEKFVKIIELRPFQKNISLEFIVLDKGPTIRTKDARPVVEITVGDETGCCRFALWDRDTEGEKIMPGDIFRLVSGQTNLFRKSLVLSRGKLPFQGGLERIGEFTKLFAETPNISNWSWVPDPNNPKLWQPLTSSQPSSTLNPFSSTSPPPPSIPSLPSLPSIPTSSTSPIPIQSSSSVSPGSSQLLPPHLSQMPIQNVNPLFNPQSSAPSSQSGSLSSPSSSATGSGEFRTPGLLPTPLPPSHNHPHHSHPHPYS